VGALTIQPAGVRGDCNRRAGRGRANRDSGAAQVEIGIGACDPQIAGSEVAIRIVRVDINDGVACIQIAFLRTAGHDVGVADQYIARIDVDAGGADALHADVAGADVAIAGVKVDAGVLTGLRGQRAGGDVLRSVNVDARR